MKMPPRPNFRSILTPPKNGAQPSQTHFKIQEKQCGGPPKKPSKEVNKASDCNWKFDMRFLGKWHFAKVVALRRLPSDGLAFSDHHHLEAIIVQAIYLSFARQVISDRQQNARRTCPRSKMSQKMFELPNTRQCKIAGYRFKRV